MKKIILTQGYEAIVDDEDYELLNSFKWSVTNCKGKKKYAKRNEPRGNGKRKAVLMHRQILGFPLSQTDHINGNGLDNRKSNLRLVSQSENQRNRRPKRGLKYKGIYKAKSKFYTDISLDGKRFKFGPFNTELEAAVEYNLRARVLHGKFAKLNELEEV